MSIEAVLQDLITEVPELSEHTIVGNTIIFKGTIPQLTKTQIRTLEKIKFNIQFLGGVLGYSIPSNTTKVVDSFTLDVTKRQVFNKIEFESLDIYSQYQPRSTYITFKDAKVTLLEMSNLKVESSYLVISEAVNIDSIVLDTTTLNSKGVIMVCGSSLYSCVLNSTTCVELDKSFINSVQITAPSVHINRADSMTCDFKDCNEVYIRNTRVLEYSSDRVFICSFTNVQNIRLNASEDGQMKLENVDNLELDFYMNKGLNLRLVGDVKSIKLLNVPNNVNIFELKNSLILSNPELRVGAIVK